MFKSVFKTGIRASYSILDNPSFVLEPWSVYPAKHKTTGQAASVFIFDKTKFEAMVNRACSIASNTKNPKIIISECYELVRFGIGQLAKLKHPQVLTIFEVLEETKLKFIFASEMVIDSLLTIDFEKSLDSLSIQKGLLQISKGLQFLHNHCHVVHFNLQPSSILVTKSGDWKLAGFKFLKNLNEISPLERDSFFLMNNDSVVPFANLNLNFTAPELVIDKNSRLDYANDIWSLGCIIYFLYNKGESIINCFDLNSISDYKTEFKKFERKFYNHRPSDLKFFLKDIPHELYSLLPQILARYPSDRLSVDRFIESDFFDGSMIKAMLFVDEFATKSTNDKITFIGGLLKNDPASGNNLLSAFPSTFKTQKLLPLMISTLSNELNVLKGPIEPEADKLVNLCLACILEIGTTLSSLTFQDKVYGSILKTEGGTKKSPSPFSKLINASIKTRLTLVQFLPVLASKLNDKQLISVVEHSLDLILKYSPTDNGNVEDQIQLQELYLKQVGLFAQKLDFPYIKKVFFPALCEVFQTTTILSTKLATIDAFDVLISKRVVDKVIVEEQLLPLISHLKSRNKVLIEKVLGFLQAACANEHIALSLEFKVNCVLTQSLMLAYGCHDCTQSEFRKYMRIIGEIQKSAMDEKLKTLSRDNRDGGKEEDFSSLIRRQPITDSNLEQIHRGPQSKTMEPTRKLSSEPVRKPQHLEPKTVKPLQLHGSSSREKKVPQLSFGASDGESNSKNTTLLQNIKSTFDRNSDDEFQDFQEAPRAVNPNKLTSIDWSAASSPQPFAHKQQISLSSTSSKIPPGFNSRIVLTPAAQSRPGALLGSSNSVHNGNLLDLL